MYGSNDAPARLSLDRVNECVHQGDRPLKLTPKAFAVLCHLLQRPARLATKDELLEAVWPDSAVTDGSLSTCIREIRRALNDDATKPRYIQTVHRRGYRYVGAPIENGPSGGGSHGAPHLVDRSPSHTPHGGLLVGRDEELAALGRSLRQVDAGERRLIFLGGEAGIGKTSLVEQFAAAVTGGSKTLLARGQCVEHYGACEAYLPWLDILSHLARVYGAEPLAALLRRCAPMWLAQLPWLIDASERQRLQQQIAGATRERMIRELVEALETLGSNRSVVLVLEDLHWSDPSSIDLLAYLARRRRPARLLVIGTYRPAELHAAAHPLGALKQELQLHGACEDRPLDFLTRDAVAEYVRARLPGAPADLAVELHRRTEGNALFIVNVIDYLLARGVLAPEHSRWHLCGRANDAQTDVPDSLKGMIERQLDRLASDDRQLLEAASVVGAVFSAAAVAAALGQPVERAEERLGELGRRGSFVRAGDRQRWPDGTESDGYVFIHALYQNVLYERIGAARRGRLHKQTGERLEAGYGDRAVEIAVELALHFQRGHDPRRAVGYLARAGELAVRRSAYVEATALLNQGISMLSMLPEGLERDSCELQLQMPLGIAACNTRGYAAPDVGTIFERAHVLSRHASDTTRLFRALRGVWRFAHMRADLQRAQSIAAELLAVAERERDPAGLVEGHRIMGTTSFHLGQLTAADDHLQQALGLYDAERHSSHAFLYGQDPGVSCLMWHAWTQWYLGYPDRAVAIGQRGIELARSIGHPFSSSFALSFAAYLWLCRGEAAAAERYAEQAVGYAREHELTQLLVMGQILHGWSRLLLERAGALEQLKESVARWQSTGARLMAPYWKLLLASALDKAGRTQEALSALIDALNQAESSEERWFDCELYLLKASLTTCSDRQVDLRRALRAANDMGSPALRLRAVTALAEDE
jgi:DNA-binding winged helix-turn-helix (wHTH) protein/predicted ATPase